jgi:cytidylate kinase
MKTTDSATSRNARYVVAIDGPAGAGKSTVALRLARRLRFILVDTGALYRGVALAARERGIGWDDGGRLGALVDEIDLGFEASEDGPPRLLIDGRNRSAEIRTPEISRGASDVSRHREVREGLLNLQRRLGECGGAILEGRDIGTVVFPDADFKFFLTADAETRAVRRHRELRERGSAADLETTLKEIRKRDEQDANRSTAPLKPAEDAVIVDTTELSIEEVVSDLARRVRGDREEEE